MLSQSIPFHAASAEFLSDLQMFGTLCQMTTAVIAVVIAITTFRFSKRQNALALINQNNSLANLVNSTIIQSEQARETFGKLQDFVVGCPDDSVILLYLNYVHNTFRMYEVKAVTTQVWEDTLGSCANMLSRLRRDQLERLLCRGYEQAFQAAVLARFDTVSCPPATASIHALVTKPGRAPLAA